MNAHNQNPLAALKDIHLPPAPGWWPPAPGWWLLIIVLSALLGYLLYRWWQRQRFRRPIKLALRELSRLDVHSRDPEIQRQTLQELSALLRRFCLVFFPREEVAGLCGQEWLEFLSRKAAEKGLIFSDSDLHPLIEEAYAPVAEVNLESLGRVVEKWIAGQARKSRRRS